MSEPANRDFSARRHCRSRTNLERRVINRKQQMIGKLVGLPLKVNSYCYHILGPLTHVDPITRYEHLVATGVLKADDYQKGIIQKLQRLWTDLKDYDPGPLPPESTKSHPSFVSLNPSFSAALSCPTKQLWYSSANSSLANLQHPNQPSPQPKSQKVYTSTVQSEQAKQCSWTFSTPPFHLNSDHPSMARHGYISTVSCWMFYNGNMMLGENMRRWG